MRWLRLQYPSAHDRMKYNRVNNRSKAIRGSKNSGTTLVEMIVCFTLLAILMVAATEIIHSAMRTYSKVKNSNSGQEISDLICDKIEAELSRANVKKQEPDVSDDNDEIFFYDSSNRPVHIINQDGYLHFAYGKDEEESKWEFDPTIYRGYTIQTLTFCKTLPDDPDDRTAMDKNDRECLSNSKYSSDIYKVTLTVYNKSSGAFVTERYIRCRGMAD